MQKEVEGSERMSGPLRTAAYLPERAVAPFPPDASSASEPTRDSAGRQEAQDRTKEASGPVEAGCALGSGHRVYPL